MTKLKETLQLELDAQTSIALVPEEEVTGATAPMVVLELRTLEHQKSSLGLPQAW